MGVCARAEIVEHSLFIVLRAPNLQPHNADDANLYLWLLPVLSTTLLTANKTLYVSQCLLSAKCLAARLKVIILCTNFVCYSVIRL